jgi:hypothetical protein
MECEDEQNANMFLHTVHCFLTGSSELSPDVLKAFNQVDEIYVNLQRAEMDCFADISTYRDPNGYKNMVKRPIAEQQKYFDEMMKEIKYAFDNDVVEPVHRYDALHKGANKLDSRWVFHAKWKQHENDVKKMILDRVRSRWVPMGNGQVAGEHYDPYNTSSPVGKAASFRIQFTLMVRFKLFCRLVDISKAFFAGDKLQHVILVNPAEGIEHFTDAEIARYCPHGMKDTLWLLKSAVYGVKQSGLHFHKRVERQLLSKGYKQNKADICQFYRWCITGEQRCFFIVTMWVDDNPPAFSHIHMFEHFMQTLKDIFEVRDEGEIHRNVLLGMDTWYDREKQMFRINHAMYLRNFFERESDLVKRYCKTPAYTPTDPAVSSLTVDDCPKTQIEQTKEWKKMHSKFRTVLGSVSHATNWTIPEGLVAVGRCAQYMSCPGRTHFIALMWYFNYLYTKLQKHDSGEQDMSLTYKWTKESKWRIILYSDSDWGADWDTRRSRSGYGAFLAENFIMAQQRLQTTTALSSAEAEFQALVLSMCFMLWLIHSLECLEIPPEGDDSRILFVDNKSAITIAHNPTGKARTKHVDIKYCFVRDILAKGEIRIPWISGNSNLGDLWTKSQTRKMLEMCVAKLYRYEGHESLEDDFQYIEGDLQTVIKGDHEFGPCTVTCTCDNNRKFEGKQLSKRVASKRT